MLPKNIVFAKKKGQINNYEIFDNTFLILFLIPPDFKNVLE